MDTAFYRRGPEAQSKEDACQRLQHGSVAGAHSGLSGGAGRDSSCGAELVLTGQGIVVADVALAAACVGHHVVLRVHGDGDES